MSTHRETRPRGKMSFFAWDVAQMSAWIDRWTFTLYSTCMWTYQVHCIHFLWHDEEVFSVFIKLWVAVKVTWTHEHRTHPHHTRKDRCLCLQVLRGTIVLLGGGCSCHEEYCLWIQYVHTGSVQVFLSNGSGLGMLFVCVCFGMFSLYFLRCTRN